MVQPISQTHTSIDHTRMHFTVVAGISCSLLQPFTLYRGVTLVLSERFARPGEHWGIRADTSIASRFPVIRNMHYGRPTESKAELTERFPRSGQANAAPKTRLVPPAGSARLLWCSAADFPGIGLRGGSSSPILLQPPVWMGFSLPSGLVC
jgi:hypothetical protein